MIDAKEAVQKAVEYLQSLVPTQIGQNPILEELEREGPNWNVTLSYVPAPQNPYGITLGGPVGARQYKIFKIKGDNGEVLSMKIRTLN
jgi:hypothetical protein